MSTVTVQRIVILIKIKSKYLSVRRKTDFKIPKNYMKTAANLSYKIYGDTQAMEEPPVLLFHGLLGSKKHWDSIGKTVFNVTKRSVVSVDLRNHGDSPHVSSHVYEELALDILKLLERLSIARASLVGHGMGGKAAMGASLLAPEKVAGLLVVDTSPISNPKQFTEYFPQILTAMKNLSFKNQTKLTEAKREAKKELENLIPDDFLMKAVLSNLKMKSDNSIGWACNLEVLIKQFKHIAAFPDSFKRKKYFGPTLFLGGQLSEYLPPDDLVGIREMFPRAVISYVPQAGHNLHIEDPKTFLEVAIAFLRTNK